MNDLNKNQLILLALLVSFVTSIATGIVTVALMDQAPPGVTQTINRVVEKTVQVIEPETETQVITEQVIVREGELVASAVDANLNGLVSFYVESGDGGIVEVGSGFLVSRDGMVATDIDVVVRAMSDTLYANYKGVSFTVRTVSYDAKRYAGIMQLDGRLDEEEILENFFVPLELSNKSASLGGSVIGLDATGDVQIRVGVVTRLEYADELQEDGTTAPGGLAFIHTDMTMPVTANGGPLVKLDGSVVGMVFVSKEGMLAAVPGDVIKEMLDVITQEGVEAMIDTTAQTASVLEGFSRENAQKTEVE